MWLQNRQLIQSHSTVSAYFKNETIVNIAKIEGGPLYKDYMRSISTAADGKAFSPSDTSSCPLPGGLCWIWPWQHVSSNPLSPMILALQAAAGVALEQEVQMIELSISNIRDEREVYDAFMRDLESAYHNAGLKVHRQPQWNAQSAHSAREPYDKCRFINDPTKDSEDSPPQLVFAAENTRQSLTVSLLFEECNIYTDFRDLHSYELGQEALDDCFAQGTTHSCKAKLHTALQRVASMPLDTSEGHFDGIDTVVLLGDASDDSRFIAVLKDVLKEQFIVQEAALSPRTHRIDPVFAASNGAARLAMDVNLAQSRQNKGALEL